MTDNLPFEIQLEIIKRLPAKSLIQFRSVSVAWKSLIDSSYFISHYSNQKQHLLVTYNHQHVFEPTYVSIVDDETFPHQKHSLTLPIQFIDMFHFHAIVGNSHGLFCLSASYADGIHGPKTEIAFLWNISIRKAVAIVVPNVAVGMFTTFLGFGVCPQATDPKIVKITHILKWKDMESIPDSIPWHVEVFTLSTGAWRSPYKNLPRTSIQFGFSQVVVNGFCYWLATDRSTIEPGFDAYNLIISFHMTSEEFREVSLAHSLVYNGSIDYLSISNLRESLILLDQDAHDNVCHVWSMEEGVSKSVTKLYTIYSPNATLLRVLEFRKSGEPVIEVEDNEVDDLDLPSLLAVYEPKSKHIGNIGINGIGSFYVYSYVETLLLLDQLEFTIFDKGKSYVAKRRDEIRSLLEHTNRV